MPFVCPKDARLGCADWRLLKNCVLFEAREIDAWLTGLFESCMLARFGANGVFVCIAGAMAVVALTIGVWGPRTKGRPADEVAGGGGSVPIAQLTS